MSPSNSRGRTSPPSSPAKQQPTHAPSSCANTKRRLSSLSKNSNESSSPSAILAKRSNDSTASPQQASANRQMGSSPRASSRRPSSPPDPPTAPRVDVEHFVRAQSGVGVWSETYDEALRELRRGRKRGHWIWYVFPQVVGLSLSSMGQRFSIHSRKEARAYLAHPVLGERLKEATQAVLDAPEDDIEELFGGSLDALKFWSSMTLFAIVAQGPDMELYEKVLATYWNGEMDEKTMDIMRYEPPHQGSDKCGANEEDDTDGKSVEED